MIRIDGYPIDLALAEEFSFKSEVSRHPVESGSDTTDHIHNTEENIRFEGVVSDTPIGAVAKDESRLIEVEGAGPFSSDAYQRLLAIRSRKEPVSIECSLGKFDNMAVIDLSIPRKANNVKGLVFTVSFAKIFFVVNQRTTVRVALPGGDGKQNFGLSLDKIVEGPHILWRKGKPPGSSGATDPPGVIIGNETVHVIRGKYYHEDKVKPLSLQETKDFTKDLERDTALLTRRGLARTEKQVERNGQRIRATREYLDYKNAHPGKNVDPALFGLDPNEGPVK